MNVDMLSCLHCLLLDAHRATPDEQVGVTVGVRDQRKDGLCSWRGGHSHSNEVTVGYFFIIIFCICILRECFYFGILSDYFHSTTFERQRLNF